MVVISAGAIAAGAAVVSASTGTFDAIGKLVNGDTSGRPCHIGIDDCPKLYLVVGNGNSILGCAMRRDDPNKPLLNGSNDPRLCFLYNTPENRINRGCRIVFYNGYLICKSNAFKASAKTHAIGRKNGGFAAWDANMKTKYKWQVDLSDPKRIRFYYWTTCRCSGFGDEKFKCYLSMDSLGGGLNFRCVPQEGNSVPKNAAYAVQGDGDWETLYKGLPNFSNKRDREDD